LILETIWQNLTWADKAMIGANVVAATIYFVSRSRKKRRLADEAKKDASGQD
jgi:hypothetical protein